MPTTKPEQSPSRNAALAWATGEWSRPKTARPATPMTPAAASGLLACIHDAPRLSTNDTAACPRQITARTISWSGRPAAAPAVCYSPVGASIQAVSRPVPRASHAASALGPCVSVR